MDEQLRTNPGDLVALIRAGRLSPERVAMAAYLGDERALATGLEPWEPSEPRPAYSWAAREFLRDSPLSAREHVWLGCLISARTLRDVLPTVQDSLEGVLEATRAWCSREVIASEVDAAIDAARVNFRIDRFDEPRWLSVVHAGQAIHALPAASTAAVLAGEDDPKEQAWQAQAIAAALLDPDWPPWDV